MKEREESEGKFNDFAANVESSTWIMLLSNLSAFESSSVREVNMNRKWTNCEKISLSCVDTD